METTGRVCCFIVSADNFKAAGRQFTRDVLKEKIRRLIAEENIRHFLCGMTPGELPAAAAVLEVKEQHPEITLDCVLPYEEQAARWNDALREEYFNILAECDSVITLQTHFGSQCISEHRKYIFANAQHALYLDDGQPVRAAAIEKRLAKLDITYDRISKCETGKEAVS